MDPRALDHRIERLLGGALTRLKYSAEGAEVFRLPTDPDERTPAWLTTSLTLDAIFRIVIQADIQRVWRELTKTDEAQGAVFNAWLHTTGLVPGGHMQMRTGSGKHVLVVGEVLEVDPPHRFVHSHRFTQYDDPVCQVAYELKPVATGVEVTLRVSGMPAGTRTAKSMQQGGDMILKIAQGDRRKRPAATWHAADVCRLWADGVRAAQAHSQRALAAVTTIDIPRRQPWPILEAAIATNCATSKSRPARPIAQLCSLIAESGLTKVGEQRAMLMEKLRLGYGDANTLALRAKQAALPAATPTPIRWTRSTPAPRRRCASCMSG